MDEVRAILKLQAHWRGKYGHFSEFSLLSQTFLQKSAKASAQAMDCRGGSAADIQGIHGIEKI